MKSISHERIRHMNISKIAQMAGVSPATVSRYLNDGYVSEEKKQRIADVIAETGYVPLTSAQNLRSRKNKLVGVIVPKINSESISQMVAGITEAITDTGYRIILANTDNSPDRETEFLRLFTNDTVDGIILIGTVITNVHRDLIRTCEKPVVLLGQQAEGVSCVYFDDYGAAYAAASELIAKGCSNLAYIGVTLKDKAAGKARMDGFMSAVECRHLRVKKELMVESAFTAEGGYDAAKRLIASGESFDGLFCATDTIAFGAMKLLSQKGICIPEKVKVCGIGDAKMSQMYCPSLTSVHLYHKTGGREACRLLIEAIDSRISMIKQSKLGYDLFVRESTTPSISEITM